MYQANIALFVFKAFCFYSQKNCEQIGKTVVLMVDMFVHLIGEMWFILLLI